jgi:hypothetical protein
MLLTNGVATFARDLREMSGENFFSAVIEISGRTVSGIMVIKKDEHRENRYRILFTTVAGPKLVDMYITRDGYEILYVEKKLKKRLVLGLLHKDFALISGLYLSNTNCESDSCSVKLSKKKSAHYSFDAQNRICKAEYRGKGKLLSDVVYTYSHDVMESISLQHYNFRMKITLNTINSTCQN